MRKRPGTSLSSSSHRVVKLSALRWMMGDEVDEVYGVTKQQFHDYLECEDIGMAVVKFMCSEPWCTTCAHQNQRMRWLARWKA